LAFYKSKAKAFSKKTGFRNNNRFLTSPLPQYLKLFGFSFGVHKATVGEPRLSYRGGSPLLLFHMPSLPFFFLLKFVEGSIRFRAVGEGLKPPPMYSIEDILMVVRQDKHNQLIYSLHSSMQGLYLFFAKTKEGRGNTPQQLLFLIKTHMKISHH
jgi:hypothetical protein